MKYNDISIVILLYKTPIETLQNLDSYKDFNLYILDQSNDIKLKKNYQKLNTMDLQLKIEVLQKE